MRVSLFHNVYRERGGEDAVVEQELRLLREAGVEVARCAVDNAELDGLASKAATLLGAAHNRGEYRRVREALTAHGAEVGHVHNWFPRLSPAVFRAHRDAGVPVVATLHNYRLGCANGTRLLDGSACERCSPEQRTPALLRRCYRGSTVGTLAWAAATRAAWTPEALGAVAAFVAPSEAVARIHVAWGLPADRVVVIPNTCPDVTPEPYDPLGPALFVGRLSSEKGLDVLLEAWRGIDRPLWIVGRGPEGARLRARYASDTVRFFGFQEPPRVRSLLQRCALVVHPHRWDEPFGLVVLEAMSAGRPVIASRQGGPADLVVHGQTGWLVGPGDPAQLQFAVSRALGDPRELARVASAARVRYLAHYRPALHTDALLELYRKVAAAAPRRLPRGRVA